MDYLQFCAILKLSLSRCIIIIIIIIEVRNQPTKCQLRCLRMRKNIIIIIIIIVSLANVTKEVDACRTSKKNFPPFVKMKIVYHLFLTRSL